jgi:hypothetical protein
VDASSSRIEQPPGPPRSRRRFVAFLLGAGALAAIAAMIRPQLASKTPPTQPVPSDVRTLLGELSVGDDVEGWTVVSIHGPNAPQAPDPRNEQEHMIRIELRKGEIQCAVWVARKGSSSLKPPHETRRYAFYFGGLRPPEAPVPTPALEAVMGAVARRVEATEESASMPEGL